MSYKWLEATCWGSLLIGIFVIECVAFSLIVLGNLKQDYDIKTSEILSFPLENNSVTIGLNFLLDSISAIISSNTNNTLLLFVGLKHSKFS